MIFLAVVVLPTARKLLDERQRIALIHESGMRFRTLGWVVLTILFATGWLNLLGRGYDPWSQLLAAGRYDSFDWLVVCKFIGFAIIVGISAVHDFRTGPEATRLWLESPDDPRVQNLRRAASLVGRANVLLALAMLWFGVRLVRG